MTEASVPADIDPAEDAYLDELENAFVDPDLEDAQDVADSKFFDAEGDGLDLEDRESLRRVAGLRTELEDITEVEYRQLRLERVVLVGVWTSGTVQDAEVSMQELAALAETAGSEVLDALIQRRNAPDPATFIGKGKAKELRDAVIATGADTVVCDGELSPSQLRKLEDVVKVKVIDRTALILDIFAQHASSREGKAQVELAQLSYMLPRLRGWGESMSRQAGGAGGGGGGMGMRGPGETKIETDRRRLREKMVRLRREIKIMSAKRQTKRNARDESETPQIAICGYTNAGKSSLLNRLTGAGVLVEDALFATLDPTVRAIRLPSGREAIVADTVGFVRHLPTQLIEAFRSTLEEAAAAGLLVHVVDGSHPDPEGQISAVRGILSESSIVDMPEIIVVNKIDAADPLVVSTLLRRYPNAMAVSARTGQGLTELVAAIDAQLPSGLIEVTALLPFSRGDLVSAVHNGGTVVSSSHSENGTLLTARVNSTLASSLADYRV